MEITNLKDLKEFLGTLTDEQLKQPVLLSPEEEKYQYAWRAEVMKENLVYSENDDEPYCLPYSEAKSADYSDEELKVAFPSGTVIIHIAVYETKPTPQ